MPKTAEGRMSSARPAGTLDARTRGECLTSVESLVRCVTRAAAEAVLDGDDATLAALHRGLTETLEDARGSTWKTEDYVDSLLDRAQRLIDKALTVTRAATSGGDSDA